MNKLVNKRLKLNELRQFRNKVLPIKKYDNHFAVVSKSPTTCGFVLTHDLYASYKSGSFAIILDIICESDGEEERKIYAQYELNTRLFYGICFNLQN